MLDLRISFLQSFFSVNACSVTNRILFLPSDKVQSIIHKHCAVSIKRSIVFGSLGCAVFELEDGVSVCDFVVPDP